MPSSSRLQFGTAVIALIGQRLQRLDVEGLLCRFGHRMELADIAAIVHHLACDNELVLVVDGDLHIVACNALTVLDQMPGVRIGQRQLRLAAIFQPSKISLRARTLGHQRRDLRADIAAVSSPASAWTAGVILGLAFGLRRIVVVKGLAVSLDLLVQLCDLFGEPLAREDARLAGVAMEERAVDRDNAPADQAELAHQQHEAAVRRLQSLPVLLAEVGDCPIARPQALQEPDQLQIAAGFPLQPTRRSDLVDVAVKVELQQIGRIVGRLPHFFRAAIRMTEAQLCKVESANEALDCADRIVRSDIVLNPGRKETGLVPAIAGLERAIRHKPNRTSTLKKRRSCPLSTGKSVGVMISCLAPLEKIFPFAPDANQFTDSHRPVPRRGDRASSRTRGGMRWTRQRQAMSGDGRAG